MLKKLNLNPNQINFIHEYLTQDKRINILNGSVRSGKTYVSLIAWVISLLSYKNTDNFLMVGKTLTALKRNCLTYLDEFCNGLFKYSIPKKEAEFMGKRIFLEGVNDSRAENKIRGMTLQAVYCDELTLFTYDFFAMLLSRLSLPKSKLIGTTNPDSPNHWLNVNYLNRAEELNLKRWDFYLDDNKSIPQDIIDSLKKEYTGVFYERFILGKWVSADGLIYRNFVDNMDNFVIPKLEENLMCVTIGIDYGASASKTVFVATGITKNFTNVYILMEKAFSGVHDPEEIYNAFETFYKEVKEKYGNPSLICADYGSLGEVITKGLNNRCIMNHIPIKIVNCHKSTINDRIQLTCKLFAQDRLKILKCCNGMISAFSNSVWDSNKVDTRLDNGTVEIDYLDAFEYSINDFAKRLILGK